MLNIVLGLVALWISFLMWERFQAFKYLIGLIVLSFVLIIAYGFYHDYQIKQMEGIKEFEQKRKMELSEYFKKSFPEYKTACDTSDRITSDTLIKCADFEDLLDKALQSEKDGKSLPKPEDHMK